ncbi:MAG: SMC-Scp complex subunit ScpB [Planctomycetota bacterium]
MQGRVSQFGWNHHESESSSDSAESDSGDENEFFSLEELGNVYANVMQGNSRSHDEVKPSQNDVLPLDFQGSILIHGETDGVPVTVWSIIESILFVGTRDGHSVSLEQHKLTMKEFSETEILQGIEHLNSNLESQNSSVRVVQDQDGFRLVLTSDLEVAIESLKWGTPKEAVLSQASIDCLSLIAYQPGIERQEIENQLGQGAGATLAQLQRRGLIRLDQNGFFTTERFLEVAGIDSLDELPKADDL